MALAACALLVAVGGATHSGGEAIRSLSGADPLAVLAGIACLILICAMAFQAWFSFELLRQNGRLLARFDALNAQLSDSSIDVQGRASASPTTRTPTPTQPSGLEVGSQAPPFTLVNLSGQSVTLRTLLRRGKPLLMVFSDPGCGPCNALLPLVGAWQREHVEQLTIALVSRGELSANRANTTEHGLLNVLVQRDREVASSYQTVGTPAAVLVTTDGRIASELATGAAAIEKLVTRSVTSRLILPVVHRIGSRGQENYDGRSRSGDRRGDGEVAPHDRAAISALTLFDIEGDPVQISDYDRDDLLLLFWNPTCGFCARMLPELRAWERNRDSSVPPLLVVSQGDTKLNAAMGLQSRVIIDDQFRLGRAVGASGTPSAVRLTRHGDTASDLVVGAPNVLALLRDSSGHLPAASMTLPLQVPDARLHSDSLK